jgi:hypothetical protein
VVYYYQVQLYRLTGGTNFSCGVTANQTMSMNTCGSTSFNNPYGGMNSGNPNVISYTLTATSVSAQRGNAQISETYRPSARKAMISNLHKAVPTHTPCTRVGLLSYLALCAAPVLCATEAYTASAIIGRPLLEAVREVEARYHWRINYEDPPLENANELQDLTHPVYRASHPDPNGAFLAPRAEPFTFSWEDSGTSTDFRTTTERLVSQHNNSGNPGVFQTLYQGTVCHIFPQRLRKKDGTMVSAHSVLDARISFPAAQPL